MAYLKINFDFFSDMKSVYTCSDVENEKKAYNFLGLDVS